MCPILGKGSNVLLVVNCHVHVFYYHKNPQSDKCTFQIRRLVHGNYT